MGDRAPRLEEYCSWTLTQTSSDRWRAALERTNTFVIDNLLELNSILERPDVVFNAMARGGVILGVALQWTGKSSIEKWWKASQNVAYVVVDVQE